MVDRERTLGALPIARGELVGGRYLAGEIIGEGGMGVVFAATHVALEAPVALKIIHSDLVHDEEFVLRFLNEAKAAALLKGEHIARVYDAGQLETGEPYLVMEKLEGIGLEAFLETAGRLEPTEAVRLVLEVCEGLAEAHALALVHRDIKPANLFLSRRRDGRSIVKILDFGIAKRLTDGRRRSITNPDQSLGSPWYMSPEQMLDPSRVDARTDIWSLGVLLFELLTNDHPFDGEGVPEVCAKVLSGRAPSIRECRKDVDPRLDAVIRRCLEKDPEERFPSVQALAERLLEVTSLSSSSSSSSSFAFGPPSSRRRRSSRPTFGPLSLLDEQRLRHVSWSGLLAGAGFFGVVAWATFSYRVSEAAPSFAMSRLERVRLPGDPMLHPGPADAPLSPARLRLPTPVVLPSLFTSSSKPESPLTRASTESVEPVLTPAEIRRRTTRYENWLRARGWKRVGDATADANNPY